MSISAYLLQKEIPGTPENPDKPFHSFGWPALLYGAVGSYNYPEHLGPFSINFCFGGILSTRCGKSEHCADNTSFSIVNRRLPTSVRTLTAKNATQLAFFYTNKWIARLASPTGIFIENTLETEDHLSLEEYGREVIPLLRDGSYPLEGPIQHLVLRIRRILASGLLSDETLEEMHAEMFSTLATDLNPSLFRHIEVELQKSPGKAEIVKRLEFSRAQIELDPVTPKGLDLRAKEAGLSKFHYLRQFKKRFLSTPGQYALQRKMELARLMLISRKYKVEEISKLLAYRSWSNFSLLFKNFVGVTPKEYQMLSFTSRTKQEAEQRLKNHPAFNTLAVE